MNTLNKLLDDARKVCERDSDRAVSQRLKVSANSVFVWRKGGKITDTHLMALIELAQADPALAVKVREEEADTPAERRAWSALWDRLSPVTTVIGGLVLALNMLPTTTSAKPLEIKQLSEGFAPVCILCSLLAWLSQRMRQHRPSPLQWRRLHA